MVGTRVTLRYAKALFEAAQEQKILGKVEADLNLIAETIAKSSDFKSVLASPVIAASDKKEVFDALFSQKCQKLTMHFLYLLLEKSREALLEIVINRFKDRLDEANGVVRAQLLSAAPIKAAQLKKLNKKIDKITGKKVILKPDVDKSLLGGFVIRLQDTVIDTSIKNQLAKLHVEMLEAS